MIIGIDLGTTNSLVACFRDGKPELIPNALGDLLTPSMVGIDPEGNLLVGRAARELAVVHPLRCVGMFKRYMGTDWQITLDGRPFDSVQLSGMVLKQLRDDAEAFLQTTVDRAVVTVPAYFNESQRQATMQAARIAGLQVDRILNEPTAAAIAYGIHEADDEEVLLVYDLGGGTFDVSIVERFEGTLEIRASSGETFLGGEDFTSTMVARLLERRGLVFERVEHEEPQRIARLRTECELAKRALTRQASATVRWPDENGDLPEESESLPVTREEFESWTNATLARTELPLRRALGDARLRREDISDVILVGGATRMTAVRRHVQTLFGREARCSLNPDEVVALGAAIQAGLIAQERSLDEFVVTDVAPFTLGVEVSREFGSVRKGGYFTPVINRNTTIPVSRTERVSTVSPNQTEVVVKVYQGEARRVEDNLFLGEFVVDGIPRGAAGKEVDIRFTYDLNGLLEVEATIVETRKKVTHLVTRHAKGMKDAEIARAQSAMQQLKMHPRDDAPNRFLIRWADRVFRELSLAQRNELEMLVTGFEAAIELNDKPAIESNRVALEMFLSAHDAPNDDEDTSEW